MGPGGARLSWGVVAVLVALYGPFWCIAVYGDRPGIYRRMLERADLWVPLIVYLLQLANELVHTAADEEY